MFSSIADNDIFAKFSANGERGTTSPFTADDNLHAGLSEDGQYGFVLLLSADGDEALCCF